MRMINDDDSMSSKLLKTKFSHCEWTGNVRYDSRIGAHFPTNWNFSCSNRQHKKHFRLGRVIATHPIFTTVYILCGGLETSISAAKWINNLLHFVWCWARKNGKENRHRTTMTHVKTLCAAHAGWKCFAEIVCARVTSNKNVSIAFRQKNKRRKNARISKFTEQIKNYSCDSDGWVLCCDLMSVRRAILCDPLAVCR